MIINEKLLSDTGWQDITLLNGVTARDNTDVYKPQIRKIGNIVFIKGQINIPSHNSNIIMFNIPSNYRPKYEVQMIGFDQRNSWIRPSDGNVVVKADTTARSSQSINNCWLIK